MNSIKIMFFGVFVIFFFPNNSFSQNYISNDLIITQISNHIYMHTSFLSTTDFGKVACNGMIVVDNNESIIFDTPTTDSISNQLIHWIKNNLATKIVAIIPTHFHKDCLGGLKIFHQYNIPSYAYFKTILLTENKHLPIPQHSFDTTLLLRVGKEKVYAKFVGEGHTHDNIIGYFPKEETLFGGCLIKELGAGKGNLEDANTRDWAKSVCRIKTILPNLKTIIPGHGKQGDSSLLNYTINLFN